MGRFSELVVGGTEPASALSRAQAWLSGLDDAASGAAYQSLRQAVQDEAAAVPGNRRVRPDRPVAQTGYAHPRHWAPFILIGA